MARQQLLSTEEAGKVFGIGPDLFEDIANAEDWLHPIYLGLGKRRRKFWDIHDVLALKRVLAGRNRLGPQEQQ